MERVEHLPLTKYSDIAKATNEEDLLAAASRHLQVRTCSHSFSCLTTTKLIDLYAGVHGYLFIHLQLVLRFNMFHLTQTVSFNTIGLDTSIPARGLHGESYRGHIFWDEVPLRPSLSLQSFRRSA
jgi:trehalose/maltose hydrolase-like predicted phosphorylase